MGEIVVPSMKCRLCQCSRAVCGHGDAFVFVMEEYIRSVADIVRSMR